MFEMRIWAIRSLDSCSPVWDLRRFPSTPIMSTGSAAGGAAEGALVLAVAFVLAPLPLLSMLSEWQAIVTEDDMVRDDNGIELWCFSV